MKLFTINVKSNPLMRQSRVESDIEHGVHLGGIGFWQEIAPKRYKAALARRAHAQGLRVNGISVECPITTRNSVWEVRSVHLHLMHKGRLSVTPTRWVVEVRTRRRSDGLKVALFGTHFISSAWSNRHPMTKAWRRKMWWIHYGRLVALIMRAHDDGYTSITGMDANRGITYMHLHPEQVIVSHHRIDGIIAVPAPGYTVVKGREDQIKGLFTDHDPVTVVVQIERRHVGESKA